jgi:hypothetical protein
MKKYKKEEYVTQELSGRVLGSYAKKPGLRG